MIFEEKPVRTETELAALADTERRRGCDAAEGMTQWRWGDRVGSGLSEFLRQVS